MTVTDVYQEYIRCKHNAFCKAFIRYAAIGKIMRLQQKWEREIYLDYLTNVSASQIPWAVDDDFTKMLPVMQTDIHLQKENDVLIIDAKYYSHTTQSQFNKNTIHSNNLYQIFTYVKNIPSRLKNIELQVCYCMQERMKKYNQIKRIKCMVIKYRLRHWI